MGSDTIRFAGGGPLVAPEKGIEPVGAGAHLTGARKCLVDHLTRRYFGELNVFNNWWAEQTCWAAIAGRGRQVSSRP